MKRIILPKPIHGDWPVGHLTVADAGLYEGAAIYVNPQGAVSVKASNGQWLGLRPGEFQWFNSCDANEVRA